MICFNCPNCGRAYELPDALSRLALLCKGCGHNLAVPEPTPNPPLPARPPVTKAVDAKPATKTNSIPEFVAPLEPHALLLTVPASSEKAAVASPLVAHATDTVMAISTTTVAELAVERVVGKTDGDAAETRPRTKPLPILVDAAIGLVLLVIGVLLGEVLARKSTAEVMDGLTAPRFPPTDLLMWLAPMVFLLLIYSLLVSRRKSLGSWIHKRSAS